VTNNLEVLPVVAQGTAEFDAALNRLASRGDTDLSRVEPRVREIIQSVRSEGDTALRRWVEELEGRKPDALFVSDYGGKRALDELPASTRNALQAAHDRIRHYHEQQLANVTSFEFEQDGVRLGSRSSPLARVGVYVPGGKASYPSTVLMCAVPARVAGVPEVIVACPDPTPEVRAASYLAGVRAILFAGGAQAVAALAYGTASVPCVDKIVGPGNLYVAAAKRLVFGQVSIDSIAGPSEILVIADDSADPGWVAADLLSQAEHDEAAYPLFLTTSADLVERVRLELGRQLDALPENDPSGRPRRAVAVASVRDNAIALVVQSREALASVADRIAAEHVSLQVREPRALANGILRAGALFVGPLTPEAAGDYLAGPSHVLPTGGAARHSAPLGVYDFVSRSSLIEYSAAALADQAGHITSLARAEGLEAHARAVEIRTRR
jgi:histidinol dehydrogenase